MQVRVAVGVRGAVTHEAADSSAESGRRQASRRVPITAAMAVVVAVGYGVWWWAGSAEVPLSTGGGEFASPFEVGTPVHQAVYGSANATQVVELGYVRPVLRPGSAPAAVGVSLCRRAPGTGVVSSHAGPFPTSSYCTALERWDGQPLAPLDYLVITVVPMGEGTVFASVELGIRDGIRRGSTRLDLAPVPASL